MVVCNIKSFQFSIDG